MGTTGLIYAAIAVAWLAYLVPTFVRRQHNDLDESEDPTARFSASMRILAHGTAPLVDQDGAEIDDVEISTPLTRRAAIADLTRLEALAARRRRRVLVALMLALTAVVSVCLANLVPWWSVVIPGGLLISFVVIARISVKGMRRRLQARFDRINRGGEEATVFLTREELADGVQEQAKQESEAAAKANANLWDPLPITLPTYVSKPLAPRTVRTIDLSSPEITTSSRQNGGLGAEVPVTADALATEESGPATEDRDEVGFRRAVGE